MEVLIILIPVALFLGVLGLAAFLWSLRSGQFEDLDGAAMRILNEDEPAPNSDTSSSSQSSSNSGKN